MCLYHTVKLWILTVSGVYDKEKFKCTKNAFTSIEKKKTQKTQKPTKTQKLVSSG